MPCVASKALLWCVLAAAAWGACPTDWSNVASMSDVALVCFGRASARDLSRLRPELCGFLTADQTANLNCSACTGFSSACARRFSLPAIHGLATSCVGNLSTSFVSELSPLQQSKISWDSVAGLTLVQFAALGNCSGFTGNQAPGVSPAACPGFSSECGQTLSTDFLGRMSSGCVRALSRNFVSRLRDEQVRALDRLVCDLTPENLGALRCSGIGSNQVSWFDGTCPLSCRHLSATCANTLDPSLMSDFSGYCLSNATLDFWHVLSADKISRIGKYVFRRVSAAVVGAMEGWQCGALSYSATAGLDGNPSPVCKNLTADCLGRVEARSWDGFGRKCLGQLSPKQLSQVSLSGINRLQSDAIAGFSLEAWIALLRRIGSPLVGSLSSWTLSSVSRQLVVAPLAKLFANQSLPRTFALCSDFKLSGPPLSWLQIISVKDHDVECILPSDFPSAASELFGLLRLSQVSLFAPEVLVVALNYWSRGDARLREITAAQVSGVSSSSSNFNKLIAALPSMNVSVFSGLTEDQVSSLAFYHFNFTCPQLQRMRKPVLTKLLCSCPNLSGDDANKYRNACGSPSCPMEGTDVVLIVLLAVTGVTVVGAITGVLIRKRLLRGRRGDYEAVDGR